MFSAQNTEGFKVLFYIFWEMYQVLKQPKCETKPGRKGQTTQREAESRPVSQAQRTGNCRPWHHSPREEHFLPNILHSRRSHTVVRKWPLSTYTLTPGEITNTKVDTQAETRMQGNGQHQQRAAGVCANPNTYKHTLKNGNKPGTTVC